MGERGLTVRERILVHLSGYQRHAQDYEVPEDMTQAGISRAIGKSRAHTTLELGRMRENGLVEERLAHVRGARSRRKVYALTAAGAGAAAGIQRHLASMVVCLKDANGIRETGGDKAADILTEYAGMSRAMAVSRVLASGGNLDMPTPGGGDGGQDISPGSEYAPPKPPECYMDRGMLDRAVEALDGNSCLVLLAVPGMGKTALISRLAEEGRWGMVFYRAVTPYDTPGSFLRMLAGYLAAAGNDALARYLDNAADLDIAEAGIHISRAISGPGHLLVVDDLDRAAGGLDRVMSMLLDSVRDTGSRLVVGSASRPSFYTARDSAGEGVVAEMGLSPLTREQCSELLASWDLSPASPDDLIDAAGGLPLALKLLATGDGGTGTLADFLENDILGSDGELGAMCRFLAVLDMTVMPADMETFGFPTGQMRRSPLFERMPGGGVMLHRAVAAILLGTMGPGTLRRLHREAARYCLEMLDMPSLGVHHLVAAGDVEGAAGLMLADPEIMMVSGRAGMLARDIDAMVGNAGEIDPALLLLAARIHNEAGNWDRAMELADMLAAEHGSTPETAGACILRANILAKRGDIRGAIGTLERILPECGSLQPALQAEARNALASMMRRMGANAPALEEIARARDAAAGHVLWTARCMMEEASIRMALDEPGPALGLLDEAGRMFEAEDSQVDLLRCRINTGLALGGLGREDEAVVMLEDALALASELGMERLGGYAAVNLAHLLSQGGHHTRAMELAAAARETFAGLDEPLMLAAATFNLGVALAGLGENNLAVENMDSGINMLKERDLLAPRRDWIELYIRIMREAGDENKVRELEELAAGLASGRDMQQR